MDIQTVLTGPIINTVNTKYFVHVIPIILNMWKSPIQGMKDPHFHRCNASSLHVIHHG